jgi:hypothetical protein
MKIKIVGLNKKFISRGKLLASGVNMSTPVGIAQALQIPINEQIAEFEQQGQKVINIAFVNLEPIFILQDGDK